MSETNVGLKHDVGKPNLALVPPGPLLALTRVLDFGAAKYGPWNWRKGIEWSRVYAAVQRHLLAWWGGEDLDPESGHSHLAHALCGLVFLLTYAEEHRELDDRYRPVSRAVISMPFLGIFE